MKDVADDAPVEPVLAAAGFRVLAEREVVTVRLRQEEPGQLGKIARRMADAGVNIEVQYSDHDHQLILVVDDLARPRGRLGVDGWFLTAGASSAEAREGEHWPSLPALPTQSAVSASTTALAPESGW